LAVKISHACREIAFCSVGYFNLSDPVGQFWDDLPKQSLVLYYQNQT